MIRVHLEEILSIPCYAICLQDMEQTRGKEAEAGFEPESSSVHLLLFSMWETAVMGKASPRVALAKLLVCALVSPFINLVVVTGKTGGVWYAMGAPMPDARGQVGNRVLLTHMLPYGLHSHHGSSYFIEI